MAVQVLEELKDGIRRFRAGVYPAQEEVYRRAGTEPQRPAALVIACADSRVDPYVLTQGAPGSLFVTRNIGNIVPAYGEMMGGVSAVLEYAVLALKVRHIVVCGHTDCGAVKALLDPEAVEAMPTVRRWLRNAHAALSISEALEADPAERVRSLTEQNVLLQMAHLQTHPSVAAALTRNELSISGWVYDIAEGQVRIAEEGSRHFKQVQIEQA